MSQTQERVSTDDREEGQYEFHSAYNQFCCNWPYDMGAPTNHSPCKIIRGGEKQGKWVPRTTLKNVISFLVTKWVKDPVLLLLCQGFNPWPRTFICQGPKKKSSVTQKKKDKNLTKIETALYILNDREIHTYYSKI